MSMSHTKQITLTLVGVLMLTHGGCTRFRNSQEDAVLGSGHRLVRVSFRGQRDSFRMRINGGPVHKLANESFTNVMTSFGFQYGDIIVWEAVRDENGRELSNPGKISEWWFEYLKQVHASFYSINSTDIHDFFQTRIYHWRAPADKPRPASSASFYVDGQRVGEGTAGFREMLRSYRREPHPTFILAPRIRNEGQASPWLAFDQLEKWAQESGVKTAFEVPELPAELTDFARLMDDL